MSTWRMVRDTVTPVCQRRSPAGLPSWPDDRPPHDRARRPPGAYDTWHFAPAVVADGLILCSGIIGTSPGGETPVAGGLEGAAATLGAGDAPLAALQAVRDPEAQFATAFEALGEVLAEAGAALSDVVELDVVPRRDRPAHGDVHAGQGCRYLDPTRTGRPSRRRRASCPAAWPSPRRRPRPPARGRRDPTSSRPSSAGLAATGAAAAAVVDPQAGDQPGRLADDPLGQLGRRRPGGPGRRSGTRRCCRRRARAGGSSRSGSRSPRRSRSRTPSTPARPTR